MKKVNTSNPIVFVALGTVSVLLAGLIMRHGRSLPIIEDARKGF